jgi:mortality factor 4-like protein 1
MADKFIFFFQLVNLPAKAPVDEIIKNYVAFKVASKTNTPDKYVLHLLGINFANFGCHVCRENAVNEVTSGIREYFNVMLGSQLLYKFERPQYAKVRIQELLSCSKLLV